MFQYRFNFPGVSIFISTPSKDDEGYNLEWTSNKHYHTINNRVVTNRKLLTVVTKFVNTSTNVLKKKIYT